VFGNDLLRGLAALVALVVAVVAAPGPAARGRFARIDAVVGHVAPLVGVAALVAAVDDNDRLLDLDRFGAGVRQWANNVDSVGVVAAPNRVLAGWIKSNPWDVLVVEAPVGRVGAVQDAVAAAVVSMMPFHSAAEAYYLSLSALQESFSG
jgi:hypothetical protein